MPSTTAFQTALEGILTTQITEAATTATVKVKKINGVTPTWLTSAHRITILQKSQTTQKVEVVDVAAGTTQTGTTVTLGTMTRGLPLDGTGFTGTGTAQVFNSGAKVIISWDAQAGRQTMFKDTVNTLTSSGAVRSSSTTTPVIRLNNVTTAQRTAMTPSNGDMVYDTDLGVNYQYIGGAWTAIGDTGTPTASESAEGKSELATVAEHDASTTGAKVIQAKNVVNSSTGASEKKIVGLNASSVVDRTIGGLGTASGTAYGILANGTTSTGATQSISPSDAGKYLKSNGAAALPSFETLTQTYFDKTVSITSAAVGTQTNPTTLTSSANPNYTIPANDLVNGVVYELVASGTYNRGTTTTVTISPIFGSTSVGGITLASTASGTGNLFVYRASFWGTAAAGGSVAVTVAATLTVGTIHSVATAASVNLATNGTLALNMASSFGSSDGANTMTFLYTTLTRKSTTAS